MNTQIVPQNISAPLVMLQNESETDEIPAYSFVMITGPGTNVLGRPSYVAEQWDGSEDALIWVSGPVAIPADSHGWGYIPIAPVLVANNSTDLTIVSEVGPKSGEWYGEDAGTGFFAIQNSTDYTLVQSRGGGGGGCTCQEIWVFIPLACSAGTWSMGLNVNGTTDTLTFDWNTSASAFDTELATHTNLTGSEYTVAGGDFPSVAIYVTWSRPADTNVVGGFPTINISSLTGNVTMYKFSTES